MTWAQIAGMCNEIFWNTAGMCNQNGRGSGRWKGLEILICDIIEGQ